MYRKKFFPKFLPFPPGHMDAIHRAVPEPYAPGSAPQGYRFHQLRWICLGGNFLICYAACFVLPCFQKNLGAVTKYNHYLKVRFGTAPYAGRGIAV